MCRWLAYSGSPIRLEELLVKRDRSLIDQSLHSREGGDSVYAFRYSSEGDSRSLYFSTRMDALKATYPEMTELAALSDETRVVVSEPLGDLAGAWNAVPESHVGIIQPGQDELRPFTPQH
jgi:predicted glutamine amidotransferase